MSQTAAHLVDHVIPQVPVRQSVPSLPFPPHALLVAPMLQPSPSTRLTNRARPLGLNLACLWLFIRSPGSVAEGFDSPSFPSQGRMNHLPEHHP